MYDRANRTEIAMSDTTNQLRDAIDTLRGIKAQIKQAFTPMPQDMPQQAMAGAPPMDPAMMGGAMPPGAPPMDPAMAGGAAPMPAQAAPPMDPAMAGGAMPPGAPPMDPTAGGAPVPPEDIGAVIDQVMASMEEIIGVIQELGAQNQELSARLDALEQAQQTLIEDLQNPAPMDGSIQ